MSEAILIEQLKNSLNLSTKEPQKGLGTIFFVPSLNSPRMQFTVKLTEKARVKLQT
jgi:hypothetical protein